jgi:hypothetical protein
MDEFYFVLRTSCDGAYLEKLTKEELLRRLDDEDYYGPSLPDPFVLGINKNIDLTEHTGFTLIKGHEVRAVAKEKVVKHDIE